MLTEAQVRLIALCKADGYGTALFAASVERSGRCSKKQYETMDRLHSAAEYRRNNPASCRRGNLSKQKRLDLAFGDYDSCCSDFASSEGFGY